MNIILPENIRLAKLPARVELALYLIESEIKSRKLMDQLAKLGVEDEGSIFSFDLSTLILNLTGFNERPDELYEWYNKLLERYIDQVKPTDTDVVLHDHAFNFYLDLEVERRIRNLPEASDPTE